MKVNTMSSRTNTKASKKQVKRHVSKPLLAAGVLSPSPPAALQRSWTLIQKNDYAGAATLLASAGRDPFVRNLLGVCLMRLGRVEQAVDVYRSFVLMPGAVTERPDVSNACKRNFATALLMKGFPSGALAVLNEIKEPDHVMAVRLKLAVKQWGKSLSWFRRLDWIINGIEPNPCHVPLDFEPGEFDVDVQLGRRLVNSGKPSKSAPTIAA